MNSNTIMHIVCHIRVIALALIILFWYATVMKRLKPLNDYLFQGLLGEKGEAKSIRNLLNLGMTPRQVPVVFMPLSMVASIQEGNSGGIIDLRQGK
ncbi:hypothetical protein FACS1894200_00910 [Spirochaetia bacterium]|nr:hypothetical protein FACS1894200_00910 [Spirochaetia bacterium]